MGAAFTWLLAGYWYARNLVVTGTPVYPLGFSTATDVLESVRPSTWTKTFLGDGRTDLWRQYVAALWHLGGPCQAGAVLAAPLTLAWLLATAFLASRCREAAHGGCEPRAALALLLVGGFLVFGATPFTVHDEHDGLINGAHTVVRYSQCPVNVALVSAGVVLTDASHWMGRWRMRPRISWALSQAPSVVFMVTAVGQVCIAVAKVSPKDPILIPLMAVNLAALVLLLREIALFSERLRHAAIRVGVILGLGVVALSSAWLSEHWHRGFAANYDRRFGTRVFSEFESWNGPSPRIAVADYRYYPFFGSRRQFDAHRPFRIISEESLFDYLDLNHIDVLAVVRHDPFLFGRYGKVHDWVAEDSDDFDKIGTGSGFDVYRIKRSNQPSDGAE